MIQGGKALTKFGGTTLTIFNKTVNSYEFLFKQTDVMRQGLTSNGKQPKLYNKVPKQMA